MFIVEINLLKGKVEPLITVSISETYRSRFKKEKTSIEGPERLLLLFIPEAITVTEISLTNESQHVRESYCNTCIIVASI